MPILFRFRDQIRVVPIEAVAADAVEPDAQLPEMAHQFQRPGGLALVAHEVVRYGGGVAALGITLSLIRQEVPNAHQDSHAAGDEREANSHLTESPVVLPTLHSLRGRSRRWTVCAMGRHPKLAP